MSSGSIAQDKVWKTKEQSEEARYAAEKEQAQLAAIRDEMNKLTHDSTSSSVSVKSVPERDFEGGYGGQEDLEDRYATTSGEH